YYDPAWYVAREIDVSDNDAAIALAVNGGDLPALPCAALE
ncbi:PLP-dependent cysteine synthase family protein, partial [Xanthomonas oryzae pv. oryzae]